MARRLRPEASKALYLWVAPGANAMAPGGKQDDTHLSHAGAAQVARLAARGLRQAGVPVAKHLRGAE